MSSDRFSDIGSVVNHERFARIDLALRRGKHFHRDMGADYEFLLDAQAPLENFYQAYGCELVQRSEGYFFLLPVTDALGRRQMSVAEMIVGQGLALCFLDPAALEGGGVIARDELLAQLAAVMGTDVLMHTFNPKKKRLDERVAQKVVRQKIADGLRRLGSLGFVDVLEGDRLKLRPSLMRFAEPVRGMDEPIAAMKALLAKGEVAVQQQTDDAVQGAVADAVESEVQGAEEEVSDPTAEREQGAVEDDAAEGDAVDAVQVVVAEAEVPDAVEPTDEDREVSPPAPDMFEDDFEQPEVEIAGAEEDSTKGNDASVPQEDDWQEDEPDLNEPDVDAPFDDEESSESSP